MDHVGPFTYNGVRFALGSLTLAPLFARGPASRQPDRSPMASRRFIFGGGALGAVLFVAASLQQMALLYTTAGKAGFNQRGFYVVIVPILGLFWSQRPSAGPGPAPCSAPRGSTCCRSPQTSRWHTGTCWCW